MKVYVMEYSTCFAGCCEQHIIGVFPDYDSAVKFVNENFEIIGEPKTDRYHGEPSYEAQVVPEDGWSTDYVFIGEYEVSS